MNISGDACVCKETMNELEIEPGEQNIDQILK